MFSTSPAALIDPQQTVGPSSAVEDQPRKQIAGLEDEVRQPKLNQDPHCEAVKYALLQEELDQFRERNLNLHVGLQVAQEYRQLLKERHEKHHALASEHERCKKLMQKAIENLSTGFDLSTREPANLGLTVEGVAPDASLLPPPNVSSTPVEKASRTPSAFQIDGEIQLFGYPYWQYK